MIGIAALEAMGYKIRDVHSMGDIAANVMNPKAGMLESINGGRGGGVLIQISGDT